MAHGRPATASDPKPDSARQTDYAGLLRDKVTTASHWRRCLIAFAAGFVSVAAFAPLFAWPVLFLTLPVLVWLIDSSDGAGRLRAASGWRSAFRDGWWWGFGYFIANLFWVGEAFLVEADKYAWAIPLAVVAMPAGLALFYGAAALLARLYWHPGWSRVLTLAVTLSALEWVRGHVLTGFPWNVPGYALTGPLVLMQSAALIGMYGLTLLAIVMFAAPLVMAADRAPGDRRRMAGAAVAAVMLMLLAGYGAVRLAAGPQETVADVKLRIVQPSIPQRDKWRPEKQREIFDLHVAMSRMDASGHVDDLKGVTHLIWPEAAMPFRPLEHQEALDVIGALLPADTFLFSGALRTGSQQGPQGSLLKRPRVYNSLLVFGAEGGLAGLYDKIKLVPFGEYLPFQDTLEGWGLRQVSYLPGGISSGVSPRPLVHAGRLPPAGILICYEAIFPGEVVQGPERPGVIITLTNDGWFGDTTGPRQHFHQARVRAVEEGVPLVRAANNGISAVVDPYGRVLHTLGMNARGVIDADLPAALTPPPYARLGELVFWLMLGAAALLAWTSGAGLKALDKC